MLTAKLILEKGNREGRITERREQASRSFVKQLFDLLYVAHAQTSFSITDIEGQARDVNRDGQGVPLLIAAAPGDSGVIGYTAYNSIVHLAAANLIGLQVGTGTTPPTPTDYALAARIPHSSHIPEVSDSRGEFYVEAVDQRDQAIYANIWYAAQFTCLWSHNIYSVKLKMYRVGEPGPVTVSIRSALTGPDLCSAIIDGNALTTDEDGEWITIPFDTHPKLKFLQAYYIVKRAPDGDSNNALRVINDRTNTYPGGNSYTSTNGGASWSHHTGYNYSYLSLFEEWGRDLSRGIEYGGCGVIVPTFTASNGAFTIKRFFTNASGDSWTINEVGIYALGHNPSRCWSFCIARDVVEPGITLLDGELLKVTYMPQITV